MAGNENSGNRGGKRGRPIQRRYTISAPAAILLKTLAQSMTETKQPTVEQMTDVLEQAIQEIADRRLAEIEI